jgi:hypothetical protein
VDSLSVAHDDVPAPEFLALLDRALQRCPNLWIVITVRSEFPPDAAEEGCPR